MEINREWLFLGDTVESKHHVMYIARNSHNKHHMSFSSAYYPRPQTSLMWRLNQNQPKRYYAGLSEEIREKFSKFTPLLKSSILLGGYCIYQPLSACWSCTCLRVGCWFWWNHSCNLGSSSSGSKQILSRPILPSPPLSPSPSSSSSSSSS